MIVFHLMVEVRNRDKQEELRVKLTSKRSVGLRRTLGNLHEVIGGGLCWVCSVGSLILVTNGRKLAQIVWGWER